MISIGVNHTGRLTDVLQDMANKCGTKASGVTVCGGVGVQRVQRSSRIDKYVSLRLNSKNGV